MHDGNYNNCESEAFLYSINQAPLKPWVDIKKNGAQRKQDNN